MLFGNIVEKAHQNSEKVEQCIGRETNELSNSRICKGNLNTEHPINATSNMIAGFKLLRYLCSTIIINTKYKAKVTTEQIEKSIARNGVVISSMAKERKKIIIIFFDLSLFRVLYKMIIKAIKTIAAIIAIVSLFILL